MSDRAIITGVDPFSECLCVIPESAVKADLEYIAALTGSTTFGQIRSSPLVWLEVTGHEHYDDDDELVEPETFAAQEPYDFHEWFGEDALMHVPLARLRTAQLCPTEVMKRYGRADDNVGFVDYEPAPWLSPEDRSGVEALLSDVGWTVRVADELVAKYLDI